MNPSFVIAKKRDGGELDAGEIASFIAGYVSGEVADYQMSALAMAICCRGMSIDETAALTDSMLASGTRLEWRDGGRPAVDKHSTGGIGDKVSLPLAAMLAACGLRVPMISGRGLGATGGTLDKLESIAGFRTNLSLGELTEVVNAVGCVITGATPELVPADRKLYALRDVTGTVPSIPLITASIMSKKLAEGLDALVLDVKWGSGAFMKSLDEARQLAKSLVATGKRMGVKTVALVTDMNQPLGRLIGNSLEVEESLEMLTGSPQTPPDLLQITLALGAELLVSTGVADGPAAAESMLAESLQSGAAYDKFRHMVTAQAGNLDTPRPLAPQHDFLAPRAGIVSAIDAEQLGRVVIALGGGRRQLGDVLDHSVGLAMRCRIGDRVEPQQPMLSVYSAGGIATEVAKMLNDAIVLTDEPISPPELLVERID
jgi:pyrimidine-nucleoside phosphorylase